MNGSIAASFAATEEVLKICSGSSRGISAVCFGAVLRLLMAIALLSGAAVAAEEPPPIQDNSFLLEEAYNQEEGVIQHINALQRMRGGDWIASFTQEWPVPRQAHQFSYTIPYQRVDSDVGERSGIGDVALNYRYQLAGSGDTRFACTPRLSLLLPTGDDEQGLGAGRVGVQLNVAASTVLSNELVAHTNLGGTYTDSAANERGDEPRSALSTRARASSGR
jgi:hypothetical protein